MATLAELYGLWSNSGLRNRVEAAVVVTAEAVRTEDPQPANHALRMAWAKSAFENPQAAANACLKAMLAANAALPIATITTASDEAILANVLAVVDVFAGGS